jgi:hypothetical protein
MMCYYCPTFAEEKYDIYNVTITVENQSESQRQAAFAQALHEVVNKLSVARAVKQEADLSALFAHPELYVESFSYGSNSEQDEGLAINVRFDREALSQFFPQQENLPSQRWVMEISGIISEQSLTEAIRYLSQINSVKSVTVQQVNGATAMLLIVLHGNEANFIQTLMTDQRFVSLSAENPEELSALRFRWIN